jgi:predicted acylesterase/phospholipase RssA
MKELSKSRLPLKAVTGFEFGAVVGAIYAKTTQPYDMEWQMMKIKEEQFFPKSLLGGNKSTEPEAFKDFFISVFQNQMLDDLKVPVACSSLQVTKQQIQLII